MEFLQKTIRTLNNCSEKERFKLYAYVEPTPKAKESIALIKQLDMQVEIYTNYLVLGQAFNNLRALLSTLAFTNTPYIVHLEDDYILAKSALRRFLFWASYWEDTKTDLVKEGILGIVSGQPSHHKPQLEGLVPWVGCYAPMFVREVLERFWMKRCMLKMRMRKQ